MSLLNNWNEELSTTKNHGAHAACTPILFWQAVGRWKGFYDMKQTNTKKKHSSKKDSESAVPLGIAWYKREEWSRLLEISADRDELEDSYDEWLQNAETRLREMAEAGIDAVRIHISVDELQDWCILQGHPVDGSARAFFTAEKLRQLDKGKTKML